MYDKYYTKQHEWVSVNASIGTVGITKYAQNQLGDVVYVELPSLDTSVQKGDAIGAVESVKAASDIYAPISGIIKEANEALSQKPSNVNKSPEETGWLCKIRITDEKELDEMLNQEQYTNFCESID